MKTLFVSVLFFRFFSAISMAYALLSAFKYFCFSFVMYFLEMSIFANLMLFCLFWNQAQFWKQNLTYL